ncbi:hypothetical protein C0993_010163, partial [Termitomyces sp. T159_Od127]
CHQAYKKCDYVHRDISGRNILIDENGRGVLNDWDLAKHKDPGESRRHERTGTWQFMSYLLLSGHHDAHTIQDDMESFFYVMLYFGLRYLQHNYRRNIPNLLKQVFDSEDIDEDGFVIGGLHKRFLLNNFEGYLGQNFTFLSPPFQKWFEWATRAAYQWIRHCEPSPRVEVEAAQGAESKPLFYDHSNMAQVFAECLNSQDWPTDEPRPIDAAAGANGGTTRTSKRPFDSEYVDEDGSIGGSRKQSRTSNAAGSHGGSKSHSQQANKRSTSRTSGSRGGTTGTQRALATADANDFPYSSSSPFLIAASQDSEIEEFRNAAISRLADSYTHSAFDTPNNKREKLTRAQISP